MLADKCRKELTERILPFWNRLRDDENGGFYGFMDNDLNVDKTADKGVILTSRILWFYSSCYRTLGDEYLLDNARHAYEFLKKCVDMVNGGVWWMMTYDGKPTDTMKHTYNQAFAIYALSAYYLASKDKTALDLALELFHTVEDKCRDDVAYLEAMSEDWQIIPNDALSENGLMADKTMNTVLHLIEAYTVLLEACENGESAHIEERLMFLLKIAEDKIFNGGKNCLRVFFDREFNEIGDIHSYGHDIEASWLIDRACEVIGERRFMAKWRFIDLRIAENIYDIAFENGAVNNERENDKVDKKRVWWVQAESVVGFVNAFQQGGDKKFLDAADKVFEWIETKQTDKRENSEWWGEVDFDGKPMQTVNMVNPWKCPYHNGRMCIEVINRNVSL
ncbi:MAG: N-acylglucosamine 2-epimerase [Oscillospiraceae bacterium]|jgi:mannobiose 2-epimerase|nr:N-acylglucosamine 2-epimerase [Oscillospiraceae bacterium]